MGRKKAEETKTKTTKKKETQTKAKAKKTATGVVLSDEEIKSLEEIEKKLLKKSKKDGFILQSEIYDALNNYELDDTAVDELIAFFAESEIEVINDDEDEEEEKEKIFEKDMLEQSLKNKDPLEKARIMAEFNRRKMRKIKKKEGN